jgi:UDP-3-O-[3-hydroxymyristoyl] glucosamine N-acyltransferase
VRLQPGVVIGSDGFGYEFVAGHHEKVPQVGSVLVDDDVEIGANSTLDRARFSRTVVGEGTKIDNLVQVAHNVVIGKHCLVCSQAGISGSTTLEDFVVLGGQAGLGGHITIGKGAKAGGQAGITADVAPGAFVNGTPAIPFQLERRIAILNQRLPDLFKRVDALEAQVGVSK